MFLTALVDPSSRDRKTPNPTTTTPTVAQYSTVPVILSTRCRSIVKLPTSAALYPNPVVGESDSLHEYSPSPARCQITSPISCSMAANSAGVPCTFGPVNHLRADTSHQIPAKPSTASTAIGV
jgi:hypothetical protein